MITRPISRDEVNGRVLTYVLEAVGGLALTVVILCRLMGAA